MDGNISNSVNCNLCGETYTLPEVGTVGNLPNVLLCGHVFCCSCLLYLQADNIILCPDCAVESVLPEGGVCGLQEDSRIIGLMYTARMNKMKRIRAWCRPANRPTQIPPPTATADSVDNAVSIDDGTSANHKVATHDDIIQTTGPPAGGALETCNGQEGGPPGQDDSRRDDQDLKEKGNGAHPDQCVDPPVDVNRVDDALDKAAENMAHLEHIHQLLVLGRATQALRDEERLRVEMDESVDQAAQLLRHRQEALLRELKAVEVLFPGSQVQLRRVGERMEALEMAMEKACQLQLHPSLEIYCNLDEVLETLQAPVIRESYDLSCLSMGSGLSCALQADRLSDCLNTSLQLQTGSPKPLPEEQGTEPLPRMRCSTPPTPKARWTPPAEKEVQGGAIAKKEVPRPPRGEQDQGGLGLNPSRSEPTACLNPRVRRLTPVKPRSTRDLSPDVVIEDVIEEEEDEEEEVEEEEKEGEQCEGVCPLENQPVVCKPRKAPPPTGPELAQTKRRAHTRKTRFALAPFTHKDAPAPPSLPSASLFQRVQVIHVLTPNHFYVRYVAKNHEAAMLSQKITELSLRPSSFFTLNDTLETGSQVLVRHKVHWWARGIVVGLSQVGPDDVTPCPTHLVASTSMFLPDYGITMTVSHGRDPACVGVDTVSAMMGNMRRVDEHMKMELSRWTPLAVKCSLKDLVPANPKRGWCGEAQQALRQVVGSAVVELQVFSREKDFLLVDLRKLPTDPGSTCPVSLREYLVFVELARLYAVSTNRDTLQFLPPVHPRIQSEHSAIVTHVNTPQDFYIQLGGNMELQLLSSKLQTCYGSASEEHSGLQLYCPTLMQACVARYRDNLWSRARIIGIMGRSVAVQYVDMGSEATVSISDLRKIKDEFFSLPAMAIQCSLADVVPADGVSWSQPCSERFSCLVLNKLVTIIATSKIQPQQLEVRVLEVAVQGSLVDLASLLVSEQWACYRDGSVSAQSNSETIVWDPPIDCEESTLEPRPQPPVSQDSEPCPQPRVPAVLEKVRVKVTHITSPGSFYVQLVESDALLKSVCQRVQECAQDSGVQDVVWKENMFCAALVNGVWERAQILANVLSDSIAEVQRCDFGGRVKLHVGNLRPLPPSLEGSLALECRLADIRPAGGPTWTATASDCFSHYLTVGALALMSIRGPEEERPVSVVLLYPNGDGQEVNLADFLANKGLALKERKPRETLKPRAAEDHQGGGDSPNKLSIVPPSPAPSSPDPTPNPHPRTRLCAEKCQVKTKLYQAPDLPGPSHNKMRVSAVGEDGVIYLQTQQAESQLEMLRNRIQVGIQTTPQQKPYTWKSVLGCALMGTDNLWYRAQVLQVLGDVVMVRYVDYGSVETIPVVHVYPTLLCEEVPQLCMPCHLNAVIPVGKVWQKDAVGLLRELLLQRSVDVQVLEVPGDPRGALTVEIFLDGLSLSRILCHHQHVYMDKNLLSQQVQTSIPLLPSLDYWDISTRGLPQGTVLGSFTYPSLPPENSHFRVEVKHICTPTELFIWPLEGNMVADDDDGLDQMLSRVTAEVEQLPHLSFFPPGGPCLAEYRDGQHYRAKLLEFDSLDPIQVMVQHVDFGSYDTLPTSKLRQMPSELLRFPVRAVKVKVAGLQPPKTCPGGSALPYAPQWSREALLCMLEHLHGDVTATVVSHEPELTVLLYDETGALVHHPLLASGLADPDYTTVCTPTQSTWRDSSSTSPPSSSPTSNTD